MTASNPSMRILFVVPSINRETGGPSKASLSLARDLMRCDQQVEIFSTCWPQPQAQKDKAINLDGLIIRLFPITPIPGMGHVPYSRQLIKAVRTELQRFDICISASLWNPLISHTTALIRKHRLPYVIMPHGMLDPVVFARNRKLKACWARMWERSNVQGANLLVFNSSREETKARACGWRLPETLVLPHTIGQTAGKSLPPRTQLEVRYPSLSGKTVVAFAGRINWVKNLDLLIAAVGLLQKRDSNISLVFAGPDTDGYQTELQRYANGLGLGNNILFTGMLGDNELAAVYSRADVVALVSKKENFGLSAAEALAAGVPVVLSDGVDIGEGLPTPPVWRVAQNESAIAEGLSAAIAYSRSVGLPAPAAFDLAAREWGTAGTDKLIDSLERIQAAHNLPCDSNNPLRTEEPDAARQK
jgi:glycosyltransferase involved in cell wall biosynthesis